MESIRQIFYNIDERKVPEGPSVSRAFLCDVNQKVNSHKGENRELTLGHIRH